MNQFVLSAIAFSAYTLTTVATPVYAQDLRSKIQDAFTLRKTSEMV